MRFVFSDSSNVVRIVLIAILSIVVIPVSAALKEVADEDTRYRSAEELLERTLQRNNLEIGHDARTDRYVILQSGEIELDPSRDPNFIEKRLHLERQLFLDCQLTLAKEIASTCVNEEVQSSPNKKQTNGMSLAVKSPVCGMQIIHQAESFDGKVYQMAIAAVWSKKLERSARSILTQKAERVRGTNVKFSDWVAGIDLACPFVTRFVYDDVGLFHCVGIGVSALNGDLQHDRAASDIARARARSAILRSLESDCEQNTECKGTLVPYAKDKNLKTYRQSLSDHSVAKSARKLSGIVEVRNGVAICPISGKKVYVSICDVNSDSVLSRSALAKEIYAAKSKSAINLSSAIAQSCVQGKYSGISTFTYSGKNSFSEDLKKSFLSAYMQSIARASQELTVSDRECFSADTQWVEEDAPSKKVPCPPSLQTVCESLITGDKDGWREKVTIRQDAELRNNAKIRYRDDWQCVQKQALLGVLCLSQEDVFNSQTGVYSVRVNLTGRESEKGDMSIDECIAHTDFKKMIGPRRYRDKNGDVWLLGIGMSDAYDLDLAKANSAADAKKFLKMAAGVEFECEIKSSEIMDRYEGETSATSKNVLSTKSISIIPDIVSKLSRAKRRKFAGEDVHPLTGKKIYTTVYIVNTKGL